MDFVAGRARCPCNKRNSCRVMGDHRFLGKIIIPPPSFRVGSSTRSRFAGSEEKKKEIERNTFGTVDFSQPHLPRMRAGTRETLRGLSPCILYTVITIYTYS